MTQINYEKLIGQWHLDRNLIEGSTDKDQYMKLIQFLKMREQVVFSLYLFSKNQVRLAMYQCLSKIDLFVY